jgi:hypothetical protein
MSNKNPKDSRFYNSLPANSSTIPDAIRNVFLSSVTVPALSENPFIGLVLVSIENVDLERIVIE